MHDGLVEGDTSQAQTVAVDKAVMAVADEVLDGRVDVVVDLPLLGLVESQQVIGQRLAALLHTLSATEHVGSETRHSPGTVCTRSITYPTRIHWACNSPSHPLPIIFIF